MRADAWPARAGLGVQAGTYGGPTRLADRFVTVAVGASADIEFGQATARPLHVSPTLLQALPDQERAGPVMARPMRGVLGVGVGL